MNFTQKSLGIHFATGKTHKQLTIYYSSVYGFEYLYNVDVPLIKYIYNTKRLFQ